MIDGAVPALAVTPEQVARIRALFEELARQFAAAARALVEVFRRIGRALRPVIRVLVRLTDQRRARLRLLHIEYRRRLRHRRRRTRR